MIYDFYHFTSIRESDGDEAFKASFGRFSVLGENIVGEIFIDASVELCIIQCPIVVKNSKLGGPSFDLEVFLLFMFKFEIRQ